MRHKTGEQRTEPGTETFASSWVNPQQAVTRVNVAGNKNVFITLITIIEIASRHFSISYFFKRRLAKLNFYPH
jgi:hypothetical protein